jgi:hypothetical protein
MKITVKPKTEATEQLNIRVPASLKQRIDHVRALADEAGVDYHATLVGVIDQFNTELEAQLRQITIKADGRIRSASTSLAEPAVDQPASSNGRKIANG